MNYYSLENILKIDAQYYIIVSSRGNGKTYACLKKAIENYFNSGEVEQFGYIRRFDTDFKGNRGAQLFAAHEPIVEKLSKGKYNKIVYYRSSWFMAYQDPDTYKITKADKPFGFAFGLNVMQHDKSVSFPNITMTVFDEFIAPDNGGYYLGNECQLYFNTISTIIRNRDNVKNFLCGNTISAWNLYTREFNLTNFKNMKPGDIDVYTYGKGRDQMKVAVEMCPLINETDKDGNIIGKPSDKYFQFDNPGMQMITGTGTQWQLGSYPHLLEKYKSTDVIFTYFIDFDDELFQCEVINKEGNMFTYIHRKTTPLKDEDNDIIFSLKDDIRINHRRAINKPINELTRKIWWFYQNDLVFYQDNELGSKVNNYVNFCKGL